MSLEEKEVRSGMASTLITRAAMEGASRVVWMNIPATVVTVERKATQEIHAVWMSNEDTGRVSRYEIEAGEQAATVVEILVGARLLGPEYR